LAAAVRRGSCASRGIVVVSLCRPPCPAQGLRARSRCNMQSFAAASMGLRITAPSRRHPTAGRTWHHIHSQPCAASRRLRLTSNVRFRRARGAWFAGELKCINTVAALQPLPQIDQFVIAVPLSACRADLRRCKSAGRRLLAQFRGEHIAGCPSFGGHRTVAPHRKRRAFPELPRSSRCRSQGREHQWLHQEALPRSRSRRKLGRQQYHFVSSFGRSATGRKAHNPMRNLTWRSTGRATAAVFGRAPSHSVHCPAPGQSRLPRPAG
jgi:hypothetical protein